VLIHIPLRGAVMDACPGFAPFKSQAVVAMVATAT
jgi:hypothetical protein